MSLAEVKQNILRLTFIVQVFHPNIDLDGNICLNILREDWKPVLSINSVIYGLQFLFLVSGVTLLLGLSCS